eukprot:1820914-Rhodomonas_salina.1
MVRGTEMGYQMGREDWWGGYELGRKVVSRGVEGSGGKALEAQLPGHVTDKAGHVTDKAGHVTDKAGHVTDKAGHVAGRAGHVTDNTGHVTEAGHVTHKLVTSQDTLLVTRNAGHVSHAPGLHTYMHTCTHMHTHAHTCTHMHTHAHTCTHMHTHAHTPEGEAAVGEAACEHRFHPPHLLSRLPPYAISAPYLSPVSQPRISA